MKVKALRRGIHDGLIREHGDVFEYKGPTEKTVKGKKIDYFPAWMESLEPAKPKAKPGPKPKADADEDGKAE